MLTVWEDPLVCIERDDEDAETLCWGNINRIIELVPVVATGELR